jgi:hypothetical protein
VFHFFNGDNLAIVDYGVSDADGNPLAASTLYIAFGPNTVINDQFPASSITFDVSIGTDANPQLTAQNTSGSELLLTFSKRTWQSISSSAVTFSASLRRVTAHIGLKNLSSQTADAAISLRRLTANIGVAQASVQTVTISGALPPITTGTPLPALSISSAVVTFN